MIRKQSSEEQIATMQRLINFGKLTESASNSKPVVEFKRKAANGKTYGIIRESTKYYIMEAPQKDTEVLAEDFDYIGGFNNRKENEYTSYAKASNALDLKLMSINETVKKSERVMIEAPVVKSEWEDKITESMRSEIDRFKTITSNVAKILKEDKGNGSVPSEHTLPEAPAKNPSDKKVNSPFTDTAVANGDKDFKKEESNHEKAGTPFDKDGGVTSKDMQSDKNPGNGADDGVYCEKTQYVDTGVAGQHPKGGKVVRVNESSGNKVRLRLTEEQVLAWNDNKNYMDKSHGTEIGSSAPFTDELGQESNQGEAPTEPIHEEAVAVHNTDNQNKPTPGTNEVGDTAPYDKKVNEDVVGADDAAGMPEEEDYSDYPFPDVAKADYSDDDDDEDFEEEYDEWEHPEDEDEYEIDLDSVEEPDMKDNGGMRGLENWEKDWNKIDNDDDYFVDDFYPFESRSRRGRRVNEDKLNDFGKHPAYRKVPMTTPPNKEVAINGAKEWDDESVQGEQPFGQKIGDSAPFDNVVEAITESVYQTLFGKKKV